MTGINRNQAVKITECPRDAMQGIHKFIPTEVKAEYLNRLLRVGFDTIDFGSFVSPRAIPQLSDTAAVLSKLNLSGSVSSLLAIVANTRGGEEAARYDEISFIGFPFSVSETFQQRNTNSGMDESLKTTEQLQEICVKSNKRLVVYLSMAFGNPYGDKWNAEIVTQWAKTMENLGIGILSLADTVGVAKPGDIRYLFLNLIPELKGVEVGAHLHCRPDDWRPKLSAAFESGCRRFDAAIKGFGGCPMAGDSLTGNLATENLIQYLKEEYVKMTLDENAFSEACTASVKVFE